MVINFQKVEIKNFKGITNNPLIFDFNKNNNKILGDNATGKTTIIDAIYYVFTTKLSKGQNQGWEHIYPDNKLSGLYPDIKIYFSIQKDDHITNHIVHLKDSKRSINGIIFSSFKDFQNQLLKMNIDTDIFHHLTNPEYILQYLDTKEQRELFLNLFSMKDIISEIKKSDIKFNFLNIDNVELIPNITLHLKSIKQKINKHKIELETLSKQQDLFTQKITITENDKSLLFKFEQLQKELNLVKSDRQKFIDTTNFDNICDKCKQPLNLKKKDIEQNKITLNSFNKKIQSLESFIKDYQPQIDIINAKKISLQNLETFTSGFNKSSQEILNNINQLSLEEQDIILFQDTRIKIIEDLFKKELEFDIKLFNHNKNGGITETFSILENGVDYKFLNTAKKIEIGLKLCQFLQSKKYNVNFPVFIDNAESISDIQKLVNIHSNLIYAQVNKDKFLC